MLRSLVLPATLFCLGSCGGSTPPPRAEPIAAPSQAAPPSAGSLAAAPSGSSEGTRHGGAPSLEANPLALSVVAAADRDEGDRKLDAGRHPAELLTFFGVKPGMKVAEMGAGGGYTAELLARAVGESGAVYGQNAPFILQKFAEKPWSARLQKPVMHKVVRLDRAFDDPFPENVHDLDVVFLILFYHDTVWMNVDRDKMNSRVYRALKPGGVYAIVDHSGRPHTATTEAETLHRIEESVVREEVAKAGFVLQKEGSFLRNEHDTMDWSASPRFAQEKRGTSDRFVLAFAKPASSQP